MKNRIRRLYNRIKLKRKRTQLVFLALTFYTILGISANLTNPFTTFSIVKSPFSTSVSSDNQINLTKTNEIITSSSFLARTYAWLKLGYYDVSHSFFPQNVDNTKTLNEVITSIHKARFDPNHPYLISGDHFNTFWPRSLGIFYHSLLDNRTALNQEDWINRQRIYLQSIAFALEAYSKNLNLTTTLIPIGANRVTAVNVFRPPSDTLFSLLYALSITKDNQELKDHYVFPDNFNYVLSTQKASSGLLAQYRSFLVNEINKYLAFVVDSQTGLVKTSIELSSAKDVVKRQSAFYDNVILWKTLSLASSLQLSSISSEQLQVLKQKIISTFWSDEVTCFKEDLVDNKNYSSDWIIAYQTGFLSINDSNELKLLQNCVKYIQDQKLDYPFGLHYQVASNLRNVHFFSKYFNPEYGTTAIWSNWGMEYAKLLISLFQATKDVSYLKAAQGQYNSYVKNITNTGCYPEVYGPEGKMYKVAVYRSVCSTGWVVSFEGLQKMLEYEINQNLSLAPQSKL